MAKYRLEALLSARKVKEERAGREARAASRAVAEAKKRMEEAKGELARYRRWRPEEEERRFQKVKGLVLSQTDLERYRNDLEALRMKETDLEEAVKAVEQAVAAAEKEEREAKERLVAAVRDREKIDEHRKRWLKEEIKRQEAAEEAELEDFPARGQEEEDDLFAIQENQP